ncbi:MAG: efflux RND transporter permease subunit, partial [bacterium]
SLQSVETNKNIVTLAQFAAPLEVGSVIVRSVFSGQRILVSDIAAVRDSFERQEVAVRTDGTPSINLVINKKSEADAITTAAEIRQALEDFRRLLPPSVQVEKVRDFSVYVDASLGNVLNNALVGFCLVVLCLMLWLDFWPALFTAIGIPASLLAGFYFMSFAGIAITNISLLAIIIVLGMLVDNGIVISEYIYQLREQGMSLKEAAVEGSYTIFWPVIATVTTTIAAFLPILLMGGIFGDWLRAIPLVVTALLIASLIEAILIIPAQLASKPGRLRSKPRTILVLEELYRHALTWVLRRKYQAIGLFLLAFLLTMGVVLPLIGFELFPETDNNIIQVRLEAPRGTPLEETNRRIAQAEKVIIETIPPQMLDSYVTRVGEKLREADDAFGVRQSHWGGIIVNLIPRERRKLSAFELKARLDTKLKSLKNDLPLIDTVVSAGGPPVGKPIDLSFISNNDELRTKFGDQLFTLLSTREGVFALSRDDVTGPKEIGIKLDQGLMSELGLTALDVALVIRAAFDGSVVTSIRDAAEEIDFRVLVRDDFKTDPAYIRNLTLSNRAGKLIKLGSFIRFEEKESPLGIPHRDGDRSLRIRAEVDRAKIDPNLLNRELRQWLEPAAAQHPELRLKFGGLEQSTFESLRDFFNASIIALLAIYILLVILFGSLTEPLIVMLAIPFGLIGVVLAFALHLTPVTFLGLIGILGLSGVVVNNSLVMLSFLNQEETKVCGQGHELQVQEIVRISVPRLRPIFLTTITTVAGLIPSVYGFFGGKIDELYPLLLAITYGLIFSTLITLFLIPVIYLVERDFSCWWFARHQAKS